VLKQHLKVATYGVNLSQFSNIQNMQIPTLRIKFSSSK